MLLVSNEDEMDPGCCGLKDDADHIADDGIVNTFA
jgi:hypothetical protein